MFDVWRAVRRERGAGYEWVDSAVDVERWLWRRLGDDG